jgi:hypothetical protein
MTTENDAVTLDEDDLAERRRQAWKRIEEFGSLIADQFRDIPEEDGLALIDAACAQERGR